MQTKVVKIDPIQIDEKEMQGAAELIREGELVAFPTETVYGLGADALHPEASRRYMRQREDLLIIRLSCISANSRSLSPLQRKYLSRRRNYQMHSGRDRLP